MLYVKRGRARGGGGGGCGERGLISKARLLFPIILVITVYKMFAVSQHDYETPILQYARDFGTFKFAV